MTNRYNGQTSSWINKKKKRDIFIIITNLMYYSRNLLYDTGCSDLPDVMI